MCCDRESYPTLRSCTLADVTPRLRTWRYHLRPCYPLQGQTTVTSTFGIGYPFQCDSFGVRDTDFETGTKCSSLNRSSEKFRTEVQNPIDCRCSAFHGVGYPFFDGVGYPFLQTMVVLCRFSLEALHTWIWLSPEGPRLYTPLSFSLNSGDLAPATLFGLTAGPHQNLDNRLAPFTCPPGPATWVHLHQLRSWIALIRGMPLTNAKHMLLSLLAGGTLWIE